MTQLSPAARTALAPTEVVTGAVTLINSFVVAADRDDAFKALWDTTSGYFTGQPGFLSLQLHRAVSPDTPYRWVNVARWATEADFRAAHSTTEFRRLVTAEGWSEFPSRPALFQVHTTVGGR